MLPSMRVACASVSTERLSCVMRAVFSGGYIFVGPSMFGTFGCMDAFQVRMRCMFGACRCVARQGRMASESKLRACFLRCVGSGVASWHVRA